MIEIRKFMATDLEFTEVARVRNLINHDSIDHPDYDKDGWKIRDLNLTRDRLLLYNNNTLIGLLYYIQGRNGNNKVSFFNIVLDPQYNNNGYRELLYSQMQKKIKKFNCNKLFTNIYDHSNYKEYQKLLIKKGFKLVQINREYSCQIQKVDTQKYQYLIQKLESEGIKFYDSREEMKKFPNHYKKLEELIWIYDQDIPSPNGINDTRAPFKQFIKHQNDFEENSYGVEIVAVKGNKYIGSTDIEVLSKTEPYKGWTGSLGVLKEFRRKGVATALKIKAIKILVKKGVTELRTDNEENNPMYKINETLGFKPVPFSLEYMKKI